MRPPALVWEQLLGSYTLRVLQNMSLLGLLQQFDSPSHPERTHHVPSFLRVQLLYDKYLLFPAMKKLFCKGLIIMPCFSFI